MKSSIEPVIIGPAIIGPAIIGPAIFHYVISMLQLSTILLQRKFFNFSGTFRWNDTKDKILLREVRVVEPYLWKVGSKQAGQGWTETANLVNAYEGFKDMPRDQRAVRERFNKLMGEFRSKTRVEENASGISPDPPSEVEVLFGEMSEIILSTVHTQSDKSKDEKDDRAKALVVRDAAMHTWGKSKGGIRSSEDESDNSDLSSERSNKPKSRRRRSRKRSGDALEYLKMKSNESMSIQQQELELRKQQTIIEQQKLEAKEKQQQQKQDELIQQQKMNQILENQQQQFNIQQQQQQMQMHAAMLAVLEKLAK